MKGRVVEWYPLVLPASLHIKDVVKDKPSMVHKSGMFSLIIFVLLAFTVSCSVIGQGLSTSPCPRALRGPRDIVDTTTGVSLLWRTPGWNVVFSDIPFPLVGARETVVLFTCREGDHPQRKLTALDVLTGDVRWSSSDASTAESMTADDDLVVAIMDRTLRAYDLQTGDVMWESEELLGHTRYIMGRDLESTVELYWVDDRLFEWEQVISYYDLATGSLQEESRISAEANTSLFLRSQDVELWAGSDSSIVAKRPHSDEVLWRAGEARSRLQPWVWLVDDLVVFATGIFPELQAREAHSGSLSWQYDEPLVSNIVVSGSTVYAIRQDATLIAVDALTGTAVELVHMALSETEADTRSTGYWVWPVADTLFSYYGDSQELFAFSLEK